jgi:uncharacterized membrane protein
VSTKPRIVWLDAMRVLATWQMVQGHTLDVVLHDASRHGTTFAWWSRARGMTSVAFLVLAGLTYVLTLPSSNILPRPLAIKRLRRAGLLIMLGYTLRAPAWTWLTTFGDEGDAKTETWKLAWQQFWVVDILQCIGVCLVATVAAQSLCKTLPRLQRLAWVLALAAFTFNASLVQDHVARGWPPLNQYLGSAHGSLFPLLPWSGYFFVGVACGAWLRARDRKVADRSYGVPLAAVAAIAALFTWALDAHPPPTFAIFAVDREPFFRIGCVVGCMTLAWSLTRRRVALAPLWVELGSRTLAIYYIHVMLVYAPSWGLVRWAARSMTPSVSLATAIAVLGCSFGSARWVERAHTRRGLRDVD